MNLLQHTLVGFVFLCTFLDSVHCFFIQSTKSLPCLRSKACRLNRFFLCGVMTSTHVRRARFLTSFSDHGGSFSTSQLVSGSERQFGRRPSCLLESKNGIPSCAVVQCLAEGAMPTPDQIFERRSLVLLLSERLRVADLNTRLFKSKSRVHAKRIAGCEKVQCLGQGVVDDSQCSKWCGAIEPKLGRHNARNCCTNTCGFVQ